MAKAGGLFLSPDRDAEIKGRITLSQPRECIVA